MDFSLIGRIMQCAESMRRESPMQRDGDTGWPNEATEGVPVVVLEPRHDITETGWACKGARSYHMSIAGYGRFESAWRVHD